jgi:Flp pilus assembly protein protease CpaA
MWRRATIDVRLTASAVLIAGSELLLTVWLVAAAAAGFYALVTLVR